MEKVFKCVCEHGQFTHNIIIHFALLAILLCIIDSPVDEYSAINHHCIQIVSPTIVIVKSIATYHLMTSYIKDTAWVVNHVPALWLGQVR